MSHKKNIENYTNRDIDVLNILWSSNMAMTASEIVTARSELNLTINTVQSVLRKLLKHHLIKIAGIVYSGNVLCRSYLPTISPSEFAALQLSSECKKLHGFISKTSLIAALLDTEKDPHKKLDEINQLEQMLEDYKRGLNQ